jgi:hypothetical protein
MVGNPKVRPRDALLDYNSAQQVVSLRFNSLLKTMKEIASLGCSMFVQQAKGADGVLVPPRNDDGFYTDVYFVGALRHTILLIEAVVTLLESGLTRPSRIVCRTLFELLVVAKYIAKHSTAPLARQLLYSSLLDHEISWVETIAMLKRAEARKEAIEDLEKQLKRIRDDLGKVSSQAVTNRKVGKWSGLSLRDMARDVGLESEYLAAYKDLSWDVHGTLAAFHITRRTRTGEVVMRDMFDLQDTRSIAVFAGNWALAILHAIAKRWQLRSNPIERLQGRFSLEIASVVWPGSPLNEARLPSAGALVLGLDVGFSPSRKTCCAYMLRVDPITNSISLAGSPRRFALPDAKPTLRQLFAASGLPKMIAIDAPLTPTRHQTCPASGRAVDKWFSQGRFSAAKRGPQTTSIAVPKQGWPLYCAGMELLEVLQSLAPDLSYIRFEDLNDPNAHGVIECIPKLFHALLVDPATVQQRAVQIDNDLFPQLFAGGMRGRIDDLLGSFSLDQQFESELRRLAASPSMFHEEIGAIVSALQCALFLTGRCSVVGCSGDKEGYFVLPAIALWDEQWVDAFRSIAKRDETVRLIATMWSQPEIVEQVDAPVN